MLAKYVLSILELNDAQREHLKTSLSVSSIISQLFKVIILANNSCKCVRSILKLNWNEHLREKTKLEICGQELRQVVHTTANRSFSRRLGKSVNVCEMYKNEKCTCKACKTTVFHR